MAMSNMQSFKIISLSFSQEASARWSPKRGNKLNNKKKTWNMANKRANKGEIKDNARKMREESPGCQVCSKGRG